MPHSKSLASYWRRIPQSYRLIGVKCANCGVCYFPARALCPECRREGKLENFKFAGRGTIYSFTEIYAAPEGFELEKPYAVALVELEEGPIITTQIADVGPNELEIGDEVEMVFRKISEVDNESIINYGFKFKPVGSN